MNRLFEFIGHHPYLVGGLAVVLALLVMTEAGRLRRKWREMTTLEAVQYINRDDAVVLDLSSHTDFERGHIVGARSVAVSGIDAGNAELMKLKERAVLLYCKNGVTSAQAADRLAALGFAKIAVLRGGLTQWLNDQLPVTRPQKTGKSDKVGKVDKRAARG